MIKIIENFTFVQSRIDFVIDVEKMIELNNEY